MAEMKRHTERYNFWDSSPEIDGDVTLHPKTAVQAAIAGAGPDMVNSPPHYADHAPECIDAMIYAWGAEKVAVYCEIAAFKYAWRAGQKGSYCEDMSKRGWYLRMAAHLRGQDTDPRNRD